MTPPRQDEITQRTKLAQDALQEAHGARSEASTAKGVAGNAVARAEAAEGVAREARDEVKTHAIDAKRQIRRIRNTWATLSIIGVLVGAGFTARAYFEQFATREKAKQLEVSQGDAEREMAAIREAHRGLNARLDRIEDKLDRLIERRERSRGER